MPGWLLLDTILLESELSQNESEYRAAGLACGALLGALCEADESDLTGLDAAAVAPPADVEASLLRRPDLQALGFAAQSARQDAVLARRRAVPDPSLSVGYTRDSLTISGDQPRSLVFNVALPIPAFDRGRRDGLFAPLGSERRVGCATSRHASRMRSGRGRGSPRPPAWSRSGWARESPARSGPCPRRTQ